MAQQEWSIEILGGINSGALSPNPNNFYESTLSPIGSVGVEKAFGKFWSVDLRAEFIQRGVQENFAAPVGPSDREFVLDTMNLHDVQVLNYLEFPLTLRFGFAVGPFRPFAFAGVAPGTFLSGHNSMTFWDSVYRGDGTVTSSDTTIDSKGAVRSFLLSFVGGIGLSYEVIPDLTLIAEGTYEAGLTNISNGSVAQAEYNSNNPYYYLPSRTPLYQTNLTTKDLHLELGVAIVP